MISKNNVFYNENFSVVADAEVCKDFVTLCVGVKNNEGTSGMWASRRLTMNEMKELRNYIDGILKTYENDSNKECEAKGSEDK